MQSESVLTCTVGAQPTFVLYVSLYASQGHIAQFLKPPIINSNSEDELYVTVLGVKKDTKLSTGMLLLRKLLHVLFLLFQAVLNSTKSPTEFRL